MFKDKAMILGLAVAALGVGFSVAVYALAVIFLSVRQEVRLAGLDVSPRSVVFASAGDSVALSARGYYSDRSFGELDGVVVYKSTNSAVAEVNARGIVTAQAAGAADIVARGGGFSVAVPVIVYGDAVLLPPPVDPAMIGVVPAIDPQIQVVRNRVMVELLPAYGPADAQALAATIGGNVAFSYRTFPGYIIEFDPFALDLETALLAMESEPIVEAAYPDTITEINHHCPDKQYCTDTFDSTSSGPDEKQPYEESGFKTAWEMMEGIDDLAPVNIAVIDDGFYDPSLSASALQNEFDLGRIIVTSSFSPQTDDPEFGFHGTAVSSVIVAVNNEMDGNGPSNLSGVVSSVPGLEYHLHIFATGTGGGGLSESAITAALETIESTQDSVDTVNMSYESYSDAVTGIGKLDSWLFEIFNKRRGLAEDMPGVAFVAAAGNCERDASTTEPARWSLSLPNAITVGGTDNGHDDRWIETSKSNKIGCRPILGFGGYFQGSAFGPPISIAAPAEEVLTLSAGASHQISRHNANVGDNYQPNGTSFAAPMVTGTAALLRAIWPDISPSEIRQILRDSADMKWICTSNNPVASCPSGDEEEWHFLRADKAVDMLLSRLVSAEIEPPDPLARAASRWAAIDIDATVHNTGTRTWPFHVEAWARSPAGEEVALGAIPAAIPPGESYPVKWRFSATEPGVWDLKIAVSRHAADFADFDTELAVSDWGEARIEVPPPPSAGGSQPSAPPPAAGSQPSATPPPSTPGGATQQDANVILLADTSGSMEGPKIEALKESVMQFIERVDDPGEFVGLADFDSDFRQAVPLAPLGDDLSAWQDAVAALDGDGGTAFYDAVINAASVLESAGAPGRVNIMIALTDGVDQDSAASIDDAIDALAQSPVPVLLYAVAYGEPGDYDLDSLERLAEAAGGAAYTANPVDLDRLYTLLTTLF